MSERHKPHNGRHSNGDFRVKKADVDDKLADPLGEIFVRDDVRLGGAVEDTGIAAGLRADELQAKIDANRECVDRFRHPDSPTHPR